MTTKQPSEQSRKRKNCRCLRDLSDHESLRKVSVTQQHELTSSAPGMNAIAASLEQGSDAEKQGEHAPPAWPAPPWPHTEWPFRVTAMLQKLEEMQLKDTLRMFNGLVERCFSECVVSFRSKVLTSPEEKCVSTCAEKYMKQSVSRAHLATCPQPRSTTPDLPLPMPGSGRPALWRVHHGRATGCASSGAETMRVGRVPHLV